MNSNNQSINKKNITTLNISSNIITVLIENKINTLGKLSKMSKTQLKELGLEKNAIKQIEIELELIGLNLNVLL